MKKISLFLLALLLGCVISAQNSTSGNTQNNPAEYPIWIELMQDQDANFYETVDAFNIYWENRFDRKGSGYKPFKRWEWYMKHKINTDGSKRNPGVDRLMYTSFLENQRSTSLFNGDWTNIGPIQLPSSPFVFWGNGRINAIAFHPTDADIIFIGAPAGGLWKSNDAGQNWLPLTDNQPTLGVSAIVIDHSNPDVIYIGSGDRDAGDAEGLGVFKSVDGGSTFVSSNDNMGNSTVGRLIQHPNNANIVIAATSAGIFKTVDGATTWVNTRSGNMKEVVFKPNNPDVIYASGNGNFYKSTDGGDSFIVISNGTPISAYRGVIDVSEANPDYVYFFATTSSEFKGVYLSTDGGDSFTLQSDSPNVMGWACNGGAGGQAWYDLDMAADPTNENVIYAGGVNCWKSIDAGQTWTMTSNQTGNCGAYPVHADLHVLEWNPLNNLLYVGNDGGIWYTGDDGNTWERITNGLAIGQQYKLGQSKLLQNHVTTGYQDNGISLFHTDTWIQSDMYADGMEAEMDIHDTTLSYGCMQYGRMYRMVDDKADVLIAGQGINGITETGEWVTPFCQSENDNNVMFVGYQNLWRTKDLQQSSPSWSKISQSIGAGNLIVVEHSLADENTFYYATTGGSLVRSDNIMESTPSFINIHSLLPGSGTITDIEAHPWNADIVYITQSRQVYKSLDKGQSWENITGNLPDVNLNDIAFYNRGRNEGLYVASNIGVFFKDETMTDWVIFSDDLPAAILATEVEIYTDADASENDRVRISTYGRGLWGSPTYYYSPVANFEASETNVPTSCAIDFFDYSQGYPHSWSWTFEGGTPSSSEVPNPTGIIYDAEGTYAVTLTVTNPDGSDTKTETGYINVVEGMLPLVSFSSVDTIQCSSAPVRLFDESEGCPTQWLWSFNPNNVSYLEGTTEASQNPIISLNETGLYSVTLTVTNGSGQSELEKIDYLHIGGQALPFSEDFAGTSLTDMGWSIINHDNSNTWGLAEVETSLGMKQVSWIEMFNYNGQDTRDELISPTMDFVGFESIYMTFDYAYAERYSPSDSLFVSISSDCGENWEQVYANGPNSEGVFATSEPTTDYFVPQSADDWCGLGYGANCPIINLSAWAGSTNVKVRFETISRFGNNLYISNVDISNTVGIFDNPSYENNIFVMQPNPASNFVEILFKTTGKQLIEVLDAHRSILISKEVNTAKTEIDVSELSSGIYFVRINSNEAIAVQKLIVN